MKTTRNTPKVEGENSTDRDGGEWAYGPEGFVFEVGSLCEYLAKVKDGRARRGTRYSLTTMLMLMILGKMSGHDQPEAIADWAKQRTEGLVVMLGLPRARLPHATTYGRVLANSIKPAELDRQLKVYFERQPKVQNAIQICIDGKQIRGTTSDLKVGNTYLLGAYLPEAGVMLFQVEVEDRQGELTLAPRLLKALDLQGKIVTGDALFTQRNLSIQIVRAGGDYVWKVKDNQPKLQAEIHRLFLPQSRPIPGTSMPKMDFRTYTQTNAGHGRIETRTLTTSSLLKGFSNWPYLEQVFKLETTLVSKKSGKTFHTLTYGVTSLSACQATPKQLLSYLVNHWAIEGASHQRRDVTFHEDHCDLRNGLAACIMAILNNTVIALFARAGFTNAAHARRVFDAHPNDAFNALTTA